MKWMGGWSFEDLNSCPYEYFTEIMKMIEEEIEARANQG